MNNCKPLNCWEPLIKRAISSQALYKRRFNDYPEREYTQASGSGGPLLEKEGEDIVYSACIYKDAAVHKRTHIV
jgi:hypothetical protein